MSPGPLGPHTFSKYNRCYWGKNYTCIKNVHGIYFIKYINYIRKMLQGSEYTRILNMSGFWIYQGPEYASGSEYARVLNMPRFWICLWFWICQGSEYFRITQGSEYASICLIMSDWTCLNLSEYAAIFFSLSVYYYTYI